MLITATGGSAANSCAHMHVSGSAKQLAAGALALPDGRGRLCYKSGRAKVELRVGLPVLEPSSGKLHYYVEVVTTGVLYTVGEDGLKEKVEQFVLSEAALMNCVVLEVPPGQYFNTVRVAARSACVPLTPLLRRCTSTRATSVSHFSCGPPSAPRSTAAS